ncbi:hypothetical protein L6164_033800 [Bauhinia variegata]|uniref:Uncharacterized protein n=1 Tax=Bauhinia variegata TaxID=167791 RepID=A0ACB9KT40_BAUVA|nr:hypothetical protein L6164_033800 [Bauhinia variegata]
MILNQPIQEILHNTKSCLEGFLYLGSPLINSISFTFDCTLIRSASMLFIPLSLMASAISLTFAHLKASQSKESMFSIVLSLFPALTSASTLKLSQLIFSFFFPGLLSFDFVVAALISSVSFVTA